MHLSLLFICMWQRITPRNKRETVDPHHMYEITSLCLIWHRVMAIWYSQHEIVSLSEYQIDCVLYSLYSLCVTLRKTHDITAWTIKEVNYHLEWEWHYTFFAVVVVVVYIYMMYKAKSEEMFHRKKKKKKNKSKKESCIW